MQATLAASPMRSYVSRCGKHCWAYITSQHKTLWVERGKCHAGGCDRQRRSCAHAIRVVAITLLNVASTQLQAMYNMYAYVRMGAYCLQSTYHAKQARP